MVDLAKTRGPTTIVISDGDEPSCSELIRRIAKYERFTSGTCPGNLSTEDEKEVRRLKKLLESKRRNREC